MIDNDVLTGAEIVEICNKYPNANVNFEYKNNGGLLGGPTLSHCFIRGYKIYKDSKGNVKELIFVEDAVIPRNG